jgi:hypothetical protein
MATFLDVMNKHYIQQNNDEYFYYYSEDKIQELFKEIEFKHFRWKIIGEFSHEHKSMALKIPKNVLIYIDHRNAKSMVLIKNLENMTEKFRVIIYIYINPSGVSWLLELKSSPPSMIDKETQSDIKSPNGAEQTEMTGMNEMTGMSTSQSSPGETVRTISRPSVQLPSSAPSTPTSSRSLTSRLSVRDLFGLSSTAQPLQLAAAAAAGPLSNQSLNIPVLPVALPVQSAPIQTIQQGQSQEPAPIQTIQQGQSQEPAPIQTIQQGQSQEPAPIQQGQSQEPAPIQTIQQGQSQEPASAQLAPAQLAPAQLAPAQLAPAQPAPAQPAPAQVQPIQQGQSQKQDPQSTPVSHSIPVAQPVQGQGQSQETTSVNLSLPGQSLPGQSLPGQSLPGQSLPGSPTARNSPDRQTTTLSNLSSPGSQEQKGRDLDAEIQSIIYNAGSGLLKSPYSLEKLIAAGFKFILKERTGRCIRNYFELDEISCPRRQENNSLLFFGHYWSNTSVSENCNSPTPTKQFGIILIDLINKKIEHIVRDEKFEPFDYWIYLNLGAKGYIKYTMYWQ